MKSKKNARKTVSGRLFYGLLLCAGIVCLYLLRNNVRLYSEQTITTRMGQYIFSQCLTLQSWCAQKINSGTGFFTTNRQLRTERDSYRTRAQELQGELLALKAKALLNEVTFDARIYQDMYGSMKTVLAQVLLYHHDAKEHYLIINRGTSSGIAVDQPVVYQHAVVGRVSHVYPSYSKVLIITDPHCKVAVLCEKTKARGIYEGNGINAQGVVKHISHMQPVVVGDTVMTAGEGLIFPFGFGVGTIISHEQKGLQQEIVVKPYIDPQDLHYCYVITSP